MTKKRIKNKPIPLYLALHPQPVQHSAAQAAHQPQNPQPLDRNTSHPPTDTPQEQPPTGLSKALIQLPNSPTNQIAPLACTPTNTQTSHTLVIELHTASPNNLLFIARILSARCPSLQAYRNFLSSKLRTTTLIFKTLADLQQFTHAISPTTFGPQVAYKAYKSCTDQQPQKPTPNHYKTLFIIGVDPYIDTNEFQENSKLNSASK